MLVNGQQPCLLDFGAAVIRKPGFAPFNHLHFCFAARLDFNQWVKFKYQGRFEHLSAVDRAYYRRSSIEKLARTLKRLWRMLRR